MRNSYEKQFWKYVAHLQENKHTEQPYRTWTQALDLDPEIRPPKKWTLKNVTHEKRSKQLDAKKKIGRPHSIIHYNTKIPKEETCKPGIWKNCYWGVLGIQEMCLILRVKKNSKAINKQDCAINLTSFSDVLLISWLFWVWFLKWKQSTPVNHNKDSITQASNFIKKTLQHMCFPTIHAKFLRTLILKNIYEWLLLKIYPVLLFWFLEDI